MGSRAHDAHAWSIAGLLPCLEPCQSSANRPLLSARVRNVLSSIWGAGEGEYFISALLCRMNTPNRPRFLIFTSACLVRLSFHHTPFNMCQGPILPPYQDISD